MKTLIAYYSRTGTTKKVTQMLAEKLGADVEEITDTVNRKGIWGYLISGRDAMKRKLTTLQPLEHNPAGYDLVIIGTPIWAANMSAPIRTYITEQKNNFQNKIAFFCTMGGSGDEKAFSEMETIIGKKPAAVLSITTKEIVKNEYEKKVDEFLEKIK